MRQGTSRKSENTRKTIMHSAKALFEKHGIGGVTVTQIAEAAGVSRSTFFFHFESVDALLRAIAWEEIDDIFVYVKRTDGTVSVEGVFERLTEDTFKYPSLMVELFTRSILTGDKSAVAKVDDMLVSEIERHDVKGDFSPKDLSAFVLGAYFGLVYQKLMNDEVFDEPQEVSGKIKRLIEYFKQQEENT